MSSRNAPAMKFRKVLPSVAKTSVPAARIRAAVKAVSAARTARKTSGKERQNSQTSR